MGEQDGVATKSHNSGDSANAQALNALDVRKAASEAQSEKQKQREEALFDQKAVAYYEALVNAWVASAMEVDKSLLVLASGAIGFSLTFVEPVRDSDLFLFFYFSSVVLFLVTIFSALMALNLNKAFISDFVNNRPNSGSGLRFFDRAALFGFAIGVLLMAIVGSVSVMKKKEQSGMAEETKGKVPLIKSLDGITGLNCATESFNGIAQLRCTQSVVMPLQGATAQQSPAPAAPLNTYQDLAPKPGSQK